MGMTGRENTCLPLVRCQQSLANLCLAFAIYTSFALLFVQFFGRAYLSRGSISKPKSQ